MHLTILVDYANIHPRELGMGLYYLCEKFTNMIPATTILRFERLNFRLYGGWYNASHVTTLAQKLETEIGSGFPTTIYHMGASKKLIANVELAMSLLAAPMKHLQNTYRVKMANYNLTSVQPTLSCCTESMCLGDLLHQFIKKNSCPQCDAVKFTDIARRNEQKLVDSMIISDLFYLGRSEPLVTLVSSDEDYIPMIITANQLQYNVLHLHTCSSNWPINYTEILDKNYTQITF